MFTQTDTRESHFEHFLKLIHFEREQQHIITANNNI